MSSAREEWLHLFQYFLDSVDTDAEIKDLVTPKKRKYRYVPDAPEDIVLNSSDSGLLSAASSWDMDPPEGMKNLAQMIQKLDSRFFDFQLAVGDDMDQVMTKIQDVKAIIGTSSASTLHFAGSTDECNTIWETFTLFRNLIMDPAIIQSLETRVSSFALQQSATSDKVKEHDLALRDMNELVQLLGTEQADLFTLLNQGTAPSSASPATLTADFTTLHQRITDLESSTYPDMQINLLKAQLKLLEARLPYDPFTIGGRNFNSKADVALFVEKEMPGISFSLIHDALTLLESITDGHTRKADVMAAMYQASRMGFNEEEATHVHSFKLIIPSLLGATKESDKNDPKLPLPAVKDFSAWNPQDNKVASRNGFKMVWTTSP